MKMMRNESHETNFHMHEGVHTVKVQDVCKVDACLPPCLLKSVHDLGFLAIGDLRAKCPSGEL